MSALLEDVVTDKSTQLPQEGGEEEAATFVAQEDTAGAASADGRKQLKRMREKRWKWWRMRLEQWKGSPKESVDDHLCTASKTMSKWLSVVRVLEFP